MAGTFAGVKYNRWTKHCAERQPRREQLSRELPSRTWKNHIVKQGTTWNRKALYRRQWKALVESHILLWMDNCLLFIGCLTSQQHISVSLGRIYLDNFTCCHTEIQASDQTLYLTQSQCTDTGPTSHSANPILPDVWQGSHWYDSTRKNHVASGIHAPDLPLSRRTP